jgi:ATP-dependent helicase/nuclease subunit B
MPLRLITGPANAGKTGRVLGEALAAAAVGASPVIAVPNLADVRRLESELAGKAPLGVRVVTLPQLTADLWSLYGDGRRVVDGATRSALLQRVMAQGIAPAVEHVSRTPGFVRLANRLAADSACSKLEAVSSTAAGRAVEDLVDRYRSALADAGLVESRWLGDLLVDTEARVDGPIGLARFDALASHEVRLLSGLARRNDVTVALTWERMFAPTQANDDAVAHLALIAIEHVCLDEPKAADEIQSVARALYSGPAAVASHGDVVLGVTSGSEAEATLIARFAADERAAGVPAERIAVAFPGASRRSHLLGKALLSHGISADFDVATPLLETHFGRAWHALLSLAAGRGGRTEALTYLASPYSGATPQHAHEQDRRWRMKQIGDPGVLLAAMGATGNACATATDQARRLARQSLTPDSLDAWQEVADMMLVTALAREPDRRVGREAAQDAAAHQAIGRLLAEMGRNAWEPADLATILTASAGVRVRERGEESPDRVQICDFSRVGARRFDVVILGGLTEREASVAPREGAEEDLRPEQWRQLEGEPADRLRLQFYSLVTRARKKLYLVRQEADSEGRECRASTLWEDVVDAYRPVGSAAHQGDSEPLPCVRMARSDIEALAPSFTVSRREMRAGAGELRLAVVDRGVVSSREGLSALRNASVFSATEIETYLECPHRWFYERVVRPEEIDLVFDARELGNRAHGLLAAFYRRVAQLPDRDRVTAEWLERALEVFEEVVASERALLTASGGLADELDAARAVAWARKVIVQDATLLPGFTPQFVESGFGDQQPFAFAGHAFRGQIDRIDASPSGLFVMDYKSSREVPGLEKFEADGKVQAVIYAQAAAESLGKPVAGSVYRSIRSGRLRGFWRSDLLGGLPQGMCEDDAIGAGEFESLVARTEERVDGAIAGMRAGHVPRAPVVKGACTYCALATTCEGARP